MIVVSDASPLNYLILINAIELLPRLFEQVFVPPKVMEELRRSKTPEIVRHWADAPPSWLKVHPPKLQLVFTVALDPGEAHAISLAKELNAAVILIDEKKGRRVATQEGLTAVGTITVLELGAAKKLLDLKTALDALERTTFRISPALIRAILATDAERKSGKK